MVLNIDVLHVGVMFWVVCQCNGTLAVGVDSVLIANIIPEFLEKVVDPDLFFDSMKNRYILRFHA